jgi:hypothetical protein
MLYFQRDEVILPAKTHRFARFFWAIKALADANV